MDATERDRPRSEVIGTVTHLVLTVHGIRTFGNWQERLKRLLEENAPPGERLSVCDYKYGYFSALAFLIPPLRWVAALGFRKRLVEELKLHPTAKVDIVAHSFGTYLVAKALPYIPPGRRIRTVLFAGSVLKPSFPWHLHTADGGRVERVVNECGTRDNILVLSQAVALF